MFTGLKNKISKFFSKRSFGSVYLRVFFLIILLLFRVYYEPFIINDILFYKIVDVIFYYILLNLIFNMSRLTIIYLYLRRNKLSQDHSDNFTLGINSISFFLNHFIFVLIFINTFVINLKDLLTTISLVAVAFVLIFKDYISNFMNGILIMFSDEVRLKDYIKIGDFKGKVSNLTFKNIELKTDNGDYVYIPNTIVISREIINYTKGSIKNIKFDVNLPLERFSNYQKNKEKILESIYNEFKDLISNNSSIKMKIDKTDNENFTLAFDILVTKYNYKIEESIKNYVFENLLAIKKD
ncbi:MAG: mechanosensitive ion channel [Candidatus Woesearchaeota archaeon]|jgi:small-conductance mechanosensitive channel|nr:mechanosensitive ion channel [Candidatus Woesearchaeota archaeon]